MDYNSQKKLILAEVNQRLLEYTSTEPLPRNLFSGLLKHFLPLLTERGVDTSTFKFEEFYLWKNVNGRLIPVTRGSVDCPLPEDLRTFLAFFSYVNRTVGGDFKPRVRLIAEQDPDFGPTLDLADACDLLMETEIKRRKLGVKALIARWEHGDLLAALSGDSAARAQLSTLSESLQKEAYVLMGDHLTADAYPFRASPAALLEFAGNDLKAIKDLGVDDMTRLFEYVFAEHDLRRDWTHRVKQSREFTLEDRVTSLDAAAAAIKNDTLLEWIASGRNREVRRLRALCVIDYWASDISVRLAEEVETNPVEAEPSDTGVSMLKYLFSLAERGATVEEAVPAFNRADQWVRILLTAGRNSLFMSRVLSAAVLARRTDA